MSRSLQIRASSYQREFFYYCLEDPTIAVAAVGGARGPGKTWAQAFVYAMRCALEDGLLHLWLRRVQRAADLNLKLAFEGVVQQLGWPLGPTRTGGIQWVSEQRMFRFPNGSVLQLGYCKNDDDWEQYQGTEYATVGFSEATQFPEAAWNKIGGSCRGGKSLKPLRTCDFNPGGRGHEWVARRIVNADTRDRRTAFVPCLLRDSMPTLEHDPGYALRVLRSLPEALRRQWEDGDMDVREGMFWTLPQSVICDAEVPDWAEMYAGVDPGYYPGAYAAVWAAKWKDADGRPRIHFVADLKRQRLNLREQAEISRTIETTLPIRCRTRWSDPAAWQRSNTDTESGVVTARTWAEYGWVVAPAPKTSRATGWMLMRTLIDDGVLTISPRCMSLITEMRDAQHASGSDDMAHGCEDHVQDCARYVCVATMGSYRSAPKRRAPYYDTNGIYVPDKVVLR